tara:strand:- start:18 stop:644 length:627 start_codon:yes stop_codon:yes gene_type:complete
MKLIKDRTPKFEMRDLSPILDEMRMVKDPKEIDLIRKATQISGLAIMEAMRSTKPGVYEYQLDAAAKYIFHLNGAQGEGYSSIIGGGTNAWMGHYFRKTDKLVSGDIVLMDYAPDYHYYTSDVTRMWPVNGKFTDAQQKLCNYIIAYRDALFRYIRPGITSIGTRFGCKRYGKVPCGQNFCKPHPLEGSKSWDKISRPFSASGRYGRS